jgi:multidrug efflux pump subunit AcrA (membrane-fusion protein)
MTKTQAVAQMTMAHERVAVLEAEVERLRELVTHCPECGAAGECPCIGNWRERAQEAEAEVEQARAVARDHHINACESCAVTESDLIAAQAEVTRLLAERDEAGQIAAEATLDAPNAGSRNMVECVRDLRAKLEAAEAEVERLKLSMLAHFQEVEWKECVVCVFRDEVVRLQGDIAALKNVLRGDESQMKQWQNRNLEMRNDLDRTVLARDEARAEVERQGLKLHDAQETIRARTVDRDVRLEHSRKLGAEVERLTALLAAGPWDAWRNAEAEVERVRGRDRLGDDWLHCVPKP